MGFSTSMLVYPRLLHSRFFEQQSWEDLISGSLHLTRQFLFSPVQVSHNLLCCGISRYETWEIWEMQIHQTENGTNNSWNKQTELSKDVAQVVGSKSLEFFTQKPSRADLKKTLHIVGVDMCVYI